MGWQVLQSVQVSTATLTATTAAFGSNLSAGTKLIAYLANINSMTVSTVKDSNNNSFSLIQSNTANATSFGFIYVMDTPIGDAGTKPTVTVTWTGTQNGASVLVQEVSGLAPGSTAAACLDGTAGLANGSPAGNFTWTWGAYTSATTQEFLAAFYADTGNGSGTSNPTPSGYTADAHNNSNDANASTRVFYKNTAGGAETVANQTVTAAGALGYDTTLVAFKLAPPLVPQGPRTGSWV